MGRGMWNYEGWRLKCRSVLLNEGATNPNFVYHGGKRRHHPSHAESGGRKGLWVVGEGGNSANK